MADNEHQQRDDEDFGQELRQAGFAARTEEEQRALLEAADQDLDDDADDESDDELLEAGGYGADGEVPWEPVPLAAAKAFQRAHPDAKLQLNFPAVWQEDRHQLVADALALQGSGVLSLHTISHLVAPEFALDGFNFEEEQQTIAEERTRFGAVLGSGDALARRVARVPGGDEEDEREPRRADVSGVAQRAFRKQQRETVKTVLVERDAQGHITRLVEMPGLVGGDGPDLEQLARQRRLEIQAKQQAEAASAPAPDAPQSGDPAHERRVAFRRAVLQAGKQLAARIREQQLPKGPQLTQREVNYTFADVTSQVSRGVPIVACGTCRFFRAPDTPSGVGGCAIVQGPIKGTDRCDRWRAKP